MIKICSVCGNELDDDDVCLGCGFDELNCDCGVDDDDEGDLSVNGLKLGYV